MAQKIPVLVTGGAGYIGSHAVYALKDHGHAVAVIDDLSTGVRENLPADVPLYVGNVGDAALLARIFKEQGIGAVMHFAGSIVVPESVADPLKYYRNNTLNSQVLIETCVREGVKTLLFSSTAAVYGIPEELPVREDTPTAPINPYGASKLMTEWVLRDTAAAQDFVYGALRYFNVAGGDPQGRTGQSTPAATHLIKVACQTALGRRASLDIMGTDYPTPDGTGVRDYIHVSDLAEAHVLALDYLVREKKSLVLNCGYGHGFSVREVIKAVEAAAGLTLPVREAPRRAGDPPALTAQSDRIRGVLGWQPKHDDLGFIVRTAYAWEKRLAERQA
jgi:UDP-glucose 4-epimerase